MNVATFPQEAIPWFGELPPGWQVKPLKHVVSVNPEVLSDSTDPEWRMTYADISSVSLGQGIVDAEELAFADAPSRARRLVRAGDILVSTVRTYLRAITVVLDPPENLVASTGFAVLRPRPDLDAHFLGYFATSDAFVNSVVAQSVGVSYPATNASDIVRLPITFPEITEQQKIAAFLDRKTAEIDTLIDKKRRLLDRLAEKRTALITRAVTKGLNPDAPMKDSGIEWLGEIPTHWDVMAIKWITPVLRGASPRPINDPIYFDDEGEYSWVRIADVTASEMCLEKTTQRLSELGASLSVKRHPGDLFLSIAGSVGKPIITGIKCCIHDGFVYFPRIPNELSEYLFWIFKSGQPYLGLGKLGTQLNLNTDTVGGIRIAVPPTDEVNEIVEWISHSVKSLDEIHERIGNAIALLEEYRSALITNAVTGQIKVS